MTAADLIAEVLAAGGKVTADGPDLVLTAPRPLSTELLGKLKAYKPDILAALAVDDQAADLREHFEERAAILEYDAGLPRPEAELAAARITAAYARDCQIHMGIAASRPCSLSRAPGRASRD